MGGNMYIEVKDAIYMERGKSGGVFFLFCFFLLFVFFWGFWGVYQSQEHYLQTSLGTRAGTGARERIKGTGAHSVET